MPACLRVHTWLRPLRAAGLEAAVFLQAQIEQDPAVVQQQAPGLGLGAPAVAVPRSPDELQGAAARAQARALAHLAVRAQQERPEGLARRPDLDERGTGHQLLAENADVAPALQRASVVEQAHVGGGHRPGARRPADRGRYALGC